ncbi:MAG: hypothetical protein K8R48_05625 [Alphaproteobacteria bacterium]|nr:hypothetical protein [Alphaproteobacteria bacterium]
MRWEKKLAILAPIEQASRCLETWLKSEKRFLTARQKQRAAALMARYFHHEDEVTDQLMLSFLNHYSGQQEVDMEDPTSVRMEIKAVLDKSQLYDHAGGGGKRRLATLAIAVMVMVLPLMAWGVSHQKINKEQQAELKAMVQRIVELDPYATHAALWAEVKQPLGIRSYQDITQWDYWQSRKRLEKRFNDLSRKPSVAAGARM